VAQAGDVLRNRAPLRLHACSISSCQHPHCDGESAAEAAEVSGRSRGMKGTGRRPTGRQPLEEGDLPPSTRAQAPGRPRLRIMGGPRSCLEIAQPCEGETGGYRPSASKPHEGGLSLPGERRSHSGAVDSRARLNRGRRCCGRVVGNAARSARGTSSLPTTEAATTAPGPGSASRAGGCAAAAAPSCSASGLRRPRDR
jgi:hypothetical protein